jgi:hypothetical protein
MRVDSGEFDAIIGRALLKELPHSHAENGDKIAAILRNIAVFAPKPNHAIQAINHPGLIIPTPLAPLSPQPEPVPARFRPRGSGSRPTLPA